MIQLAYGKYYGCTMKVHSKATKKGEEVGSLERCRSKLDKLVDRARSKYGDACVELTSDDVANFANQCVADTADASTGDIASSALASTVGETCSGGT